MLRIAHTQTHSSWGLLTTLVFYLETNRLEPTAYQP
jgi:hypothetical protein